ncbi:hypothetical protein CDD81_2827 [Ophiocordyceps australis]|uniref:Uncharacterized protein n=1 Tax=Ophiocordyceps australis TaxID=1399860 RepID=A0A2C5XQR1_9HYPO|nr:hypothetical protein CDD81_2827 [Ophiocordyceps australis]
MYLVPLFCLVHLAAAWVMPDNLQDGMYMVDIGRRGPRLHRRVDNWLPTADSSTSVQGVDPGKRADFNTRKGRKRIRVHQVTAPFRNASHHDLLPVPVGGHHCDKLVSKLPLWEYAEARQGLKRYCDEYLVPEKTMHLAVSANGSVAAFVCNYASYPQVCSGREFQWIERHWLDRRCGFGFPGQVWVQFWEKWYGRAFPGMKLCPLRIWEGRRLRESLWMGYPHATRDKCRKDCEGDEESIEDDFKPPKPYYGNLRGWNTGLPRLLRPWRYPWPLWDGWF